MFDRQCLNCAYLKHAITSLNERLCCSIVVSLHLVSITFSPARPIGERAIRAQCLKQIAVFANTLHRITCILQDL